MGESVTLCRDGVEGHKKRNRRALFAQTALHHHCPVPVAVVKNPWRLNPSRFQRQPSPTTSTLPERAWACLECRPQSTGSSASSDTCKHLFHQQCHDSRLNCTTLHPNIIVSPVICCARLCAQTDIPQYSTPNLKIVLDSKTPATCVLNSPATVRYRFNTTPIQATSRDRIFSIHVLVPSADRYTRGGIVPAQQELNEGDGLTVFPLWTRRPTTWTLLWMVMMWHTRVKDAEMWVFFGQAVDGLID